MGECCKGGPKVCKWRGRPLEELSKEELIQVIHWLAEEQERMRTMHKKDIELFSLMARR